MEVEKFLHKCGDFNRYQFLMLGIFAVINILSSVHYFSQTIISFIPEHWCQSPGVENFTISELKQWNEELDQQLTCRPLEEITKGETSGRCSQWIYDSDHGFKSLTSELNWVCDHKWKATVGQSLFFIGSVFGVIFGVLADRIGRLPVLILANLTAMLGNLATMYSKDVISFSVARFISGMATDSNFVMIYILVLEYLRQSSRTFGLNLCIGIFYCLGSVMTPLIALQIGEWRLFLEATAIPLLVVPSFWFILPESIHWLVAAKKPERALDMFYKVAKFNGKVLPEKFTEEFKDAYDNYSKVHANGTGPQETLYGLFRTPRLRKNMLILFFKSMVITLCYDAISRNVEGLGVSPFLVFSISATSILPACLVILLLQDRVGRKAMASSSLLLSGFITCTTGVLLKVLGSHLDPYVAVGLVTTARFGIVIAYNSSAQYATEIIPTSVRGQGVVAVHIVGYAFTFLSSYILYLSHYVNYLPSLVLGALSVLGAAFCLLLPETLNRPIPATLAEAENFGRGESILYFSCFGGPGLRKRDEVDMSTETNIDHV